MVKKNRAIFLDRDGIINIERNDYTFRIEDFEFVTGIIESLKKLQNAGFLLIVISNQGGIAKGLYTITDVEIVHKFMNDKLNENGVFLTEVYYCPHYPSIGKCICRKPDTVMIEKALARFNISSENSYFIGDRETDIEAANRCKIKSFLVKDNQPITDIVKLIISESHE
jgi:D-glycero-D-manno-heptose 1,7-bisphosphate phosphatase